MSSDPGGHKSVAEWGRKQVSEILQFRVAFLGVSG